MGASGHLEGLSTRPSQAGLVPVCNECALACGVVVLRCWRRPSKSLRVNLTSHWSSWKWKMEPQQRYGKVCALLRDLPCARGTAGWWSLVTWGGGAELALLPPASPEPQLVKRGRTTETPPTSKGLQGRVDHAETRVKDL